MFSTHYHKLLDDFKSMPGVSTYHMSYIQNAGSDNITFLYKFIQGECPHSFGLNVARIAGIPKGILEKAKNKSVAFSNNLDVLTKVGS